MLVEDMMTKQVVALDSAVPIGDVTTLMEQRGIRHFPIVEEGELVGIVSDRDLRTVGSEHPKAKEGVSFKDEVAKMMNAPVITAHPRDPIEEAAKVLCENKIGAMPVLQEGELVGIVTAVDFLRELTTMTGVRASSTRLEVELDNSPGSLAALLASIASHNVGVSSVLSTGKDNETVSFVLRVDTIDGRGLAAMLRENGFNVLWPQAKQDG